jgi:hypothetical protein
MRTFRIVVASLALLPAIGWADLASAWGDLGHKIVWEIAFHEFTIDSEQTRSAAEAFIGAIRILGP